MTCDICGRHADKLETFRDADWCPECKREYEQARKLLARAAKVAMVNRLQRRQEN